MQQILGLSVTQLSCKIAVLLGFRFVAHANDDGVNVFQSN